MRSFSRQSCFFAFHLFPEWLYGYRKPGDPASEGEVQEVIEGLWGQAHLLASSVTGNSTRAVATPTCAVHHGVGGQWWSVRMPRALEPPEPSLLVANFSEPTLHLAEIFQAQMRPMLWARVSATGEHAIVNWLEDGKRESIIQSVNEYGRVDRLRPLDAGSVLTQLAIYAQINHELERARSDKTG